VTTLRKQVSDALRARGYKRIDRSVHLLRLDADFSLAVNTGVVGLAADIAPFIGLRSDSVEAARAELMALPEYPSTLTVAANVGYVLDGVYRAWPPGSPSDLLPMIDAGLDALRPFASLSNLGSAFGIKGIAESPGTPYVAVVVALLLKDRASVFSALNRARSAFCSQPDEVCDQFLAFESRVLQRLSALSSGLTEH